MAFKDLSGTSILYALFSREEGTEGRLYGNPNPVQFGQVGYEEQARRCQSDLPNPESDSPEYINLVLFIQSAVKSKPSSTPVLSPNHSDQKHDCYFIAH